MIRKGQAFFLLFMVGVCVIILALAFAPVVKEFNDNSRNTTTWDGANGLDCSNASISDFQSATCVINDISTASFIGIVIAIGLAVMGGKLLLQ